jgi:hypothetical protein
MNWRIVLGKQHNFTVIKGGENIVKPPRGYQFISGYVTNTRLMGVLTLYLHWKSENRDNPLVFHQFFYFDAEEYGLESYKSSMIDDEVALDFIEQSLIGGLGGIKISVSEKEARYLLQSFITASKKLNVTLPEPKNEYDFLLEEPVNLTEKEKQTLQDKICTPILSDYHLIHYYIMRLLAGDIEAASYLTQGEIIIDGISDSIPSTLCRNTIEDYIDDAGNLSYLCEALIEKDEIYNLIVFEVTVSNNKVTSASRRSCFRVSPAEAAMLLNRPEYITVYEIITDPDDFDENFLTITKGSMLTVHENGRLFMEFKKNNDHVNQKIFRLNEDIYGLYYVTDYGQLIIAAYNLNDIQIIESSLQKSPLRLSLFPTGKYEFKEPILYEFIQSDFDDFVDFLDSLK